MTSTELPALFSGLLDDAAMFPPEDAPLDQAVDGHIVHRAAWYADMVGSFACTAARLGALSEAVARRGAGTFAVTLVVPQGFDGLAAALETARQSDAIRLAAVEVPLGVQRLEAAIDQLSALVELGIGASVEIAVGAVTERQVHQLASSGVRLKLRTGGTTIDAFATEAELARPIVLCAAERQAFKCTAGLHHAVRHRARSTLFEHHGFLNIALAARVAASTGSVTATRDVLGQREPHRIADRVRELTATDVRSIRAMFVSFGTCSVLDPVTDLVELGLLAPR